jgi:tRNA-Thr(GGU) m(6)t(6)A37 methyltransferase TsaA
MASGRAKDELVLRPIGFARTPFSDRASAPRQPAVAQGVRGTIELLPSSKFEHALEDLDSWDHIWIIFWFHLNEGWRPKVLPPRSKKRRGVFATRSPYRPNPIGLSVVELEAVEGLTLKIRNVDLLDGTPVLDIKPYVPFADAIASAKTGWLDARDPGPKFDVDWGPLASEQARWLQETHEIELVERVTRTLSIGPEPHPYRRIRRQKVGYRLAVKEWRVEFRVDGRSVTVDAIATGYRARDLEASSGGPELAVHRAFVARFG